MAFARGAAEGDREWPSLSNGIPINGLCNAAEGRREWPSLSNGIPTERKEIEKAWVASGKGRKGQMEQEGLQSPKTTLLNISRGRECVGAIVQNLLRFEKSSTIYSLLYTR